MERACQQNDTVSPTARNAYLFADDNRKMGTFLIDLSRAPGRGLFASAINNVLGQFDPAAVQVLEGWRVEGWRAMQRASCHAAMRRRAVQRASCPCVDHLNAHDGQQCEWHPAEHGYTRT